MKDSGLVRIDERRGGQDMFWNRAMVPIMDINGKLSALEDVYWGMEHQVY